MADFTNHIAQSKKNIYLLKFLNDNPTSDIDKQWQITVAYYSALHLINAFLSDKADLHPNNHHSLKEFIEPSAVNTIGEDLYASYTHLEMLSRKARYLCDNSGQNSSSKGFISNKKDFQRAIKYLDQVKCFINKEYSLGLSVIELDIDETPHTINLTFFSINRVTI